jgi:hypothetical protein
VGEVFLVEVRRAITAVVVFAPEVLVRSLVLANALLLLFLFLFEHRLSTRLLLVSHLVALGYVILHTNKRHNEAQLVSTSATSTRSNRMAAGR